MHLKSARSTRSLAIALLLLSASSAAKAACVSPAPANAAAVQAFTSSPASLLSANPNGGAALISAIRNLAVSDRAAISGITTLISSANPDQMSAIGTALGQATNLCLRTERETAVALQALVASTDKPALTTAFRAVAGDPRTAATGGNTGGAQGGGAAGAGGQGATGGGGLGGSGVTGSSTTSASGGGRNDARPVTLTNANGSSGINAGSGSSVSPLSRRSVSASVSPSR